jgi:methionyl-tRNA synthetase
MIFQNGKRLAFIETGVEDVSFSRSKEYLSWGVEVPNDPTQVMYVWCDALTNYLTAAGAASFWPSERMLNVIGKDILRFHALYWPAMLISAGKENIKDILVHGHVLSGGQKMSKTLGNVIDPVQVLEMYNAALGEKSILKDDLGSEFFRYFVLRNISPFSDGDITHERMKELYNADLANGIGNLVNRTMKLCSTYLESNFDEASPLAPLPERGEYEEAMEVYDVKSAFDYVFKVVAEADQYMQTNQPFKVIKTDPEQGRQMLQYMREQVYLIARLIHPFMPKTSTVIKDIVVTNTMPEKPIFPRFD